FLRFLNKPHTANSAFQQYLFRQNSADNQLFAGNNKLSVRQQQAELLLTKMEDSAVILYIHLQMTDHCDARDFQDHIWWQIQHTHCHLPQAAAPTFHTVSPPSYWRCCAEIHL
ncbi:hypothetical protein MXD63_38515, partial [Frankia sp. Cpl3]|nr:hypothetical protein [Frankia sp. Cpl3]